MAAELYILRQAPAARATRVERSARPMPEGDPLQVPCHASSRLSTACSGPPSPASRHVLLDMWPPRLPNSPRAFTVLPGAIVWQREDEDDDAFADRARETARLCGCDELIILYWSTTCNFR
jgi:hypothetical protein